MMISTIGPRFSTSKVFYLAEFFGGTSVRALIAVLSIFEITLPSGDLFAALLSPLLSLSLGEKSFGS